MSSNIPNVQRKSRFCSYGLGCLRKKCIFAHFFDDLTPVLCRFDKRCKHEKCFFIHSNETKEEYVIRVYKREDISHISLPSENEHYIEQVKETLRNLEESKNRKQRQKPFPYSSFEDYKNSQEAHHLMRANWEDIYDLDSDEDEDEDKDKKNVRYVIWGDGVVEDKVNGKMYHLDD